MTLFKEPEISIAIKLKRLQWAGHLQRMDEQNLPKKDFTRQILGKRPVVKPRKRGIDLVEEDIIRLLTRRNWKNLAEDRAQWRAKVKEANARFGLQSH
jgi:hypothetical protein